jgi:adenylate cyclase
VGSLMLPTDQKLRMLINYAGRDRRFPGVSATDVLYGREPAGIFAGKVVLVGTAALGTYDQLSTPFSANFPGVEKNATVVENIIHGQLFSTSLWSGPAEVALVMALGLVLTVILPRVPALHGLVLVLCVGAAYFSLAQYFFAVERLTLPLLMPMTTLGVVFMVTTVLSYMVREQQAKDIQAMFASYVSPRIVQELMKSPAKAALGGERKELTMLFADVVGFTSYSERRSAEAVVEQLNEYLGAMTDVIFRWNGTLDKFVGDEIVVFWGAPIDQPDHVELAVSCALEMRARLSTLQTKWQEAGKPMLDNGIGINTGSVVVGNIGAQGKKMDYTVIGDQVNLASRIQGLTRTLGHSILLTEQTATLLEQTAGLSQVALRKVRVVTVKGREEPVGVYTVERVSDETEGPRRREAQAG